MVCCMESFIGLVLKPGGTLVASVLEEILLEAAARGVKICVERESSKYYANLLSRYTSCIFDIREKIPHKLVIIGGDGTFLRLNSRLGDRDSPVIMGVRAGRRGFLLEVEPQEARKRFTEFLEDKFSVQYIYRVKPVIPGVEDLPPALNEIAIQAPRGKIARFDISIGGEHLYGVEGDGVIIASVAGSTAYSLSAGGPVLDPSLQAFVITPLNPIQLHVRPVVVSSDKVIKIRVIPSGEKGIVVIDSQRFIEVEKPVMITVTKSTHPVKIARFSEKGYYERLWLKALGYV